MWSRDARGQSLQRRLRRAARATWLHVGATRAAGALGGELLGASLSELPSGQATLPFHWHWANEELLIVVASQVTLRTPDGKRELNAGDVVAFPRGLAGGHGRLLGGGACARRWLRERLALTRPGRCPPEVPPKRFRGSAWRVSRKQKNPLSERAYPKRLMGHEPTTVCMASRRWVCHEPAKCLHTNDFRQARPRAGVPRIVRRYPGFRQGTDNERSLALGGSAGSRVAIESASASTVRADSAPADTCVSSRCRSGSGACRDIRFHVRSDSHRRRRQDARFHGKASVCSRLNRAPRRRPRRQRSRLACRARLLRESSGGHATASAASPGRPGRPLHPPVAVLHCGLGTRQRPPGEDAVCDLRWT